jgi:hypothetical protein
MKVDRVILVLNNNPKYTFFWDYWIKNIIDFCSNRNKNFDMNMLKEGRYSEITTKNFFAHKTKIENIINNIPKYNF